MPWPRLRFAQADLARLCQPRAVYPTEYHVQNELYGLAWLLKEYAGLPRHEPLPWAMEHAIIFEHPTPHPADVESTLPLRLAISEGQAAVLARHVAVPVIPIGSAYFYMRAMFDRWYPASPAELERRGTLVFPDKSTEDLETEFDRERFAAELASLPEEFQPVAVSVYWKDYQEGHHLPYANAGLRLVSSGHPYDPMFLFRQFDLCRQFKYACANDLSSSFCFSVLAGCRFFHWSTGPVQMRKKGVTRSYEQDPTLALPAKQACLAASPYPPAGDGSAQRELAKRFAGKASVRPPDFFHDLVREGRRLLLAGPAAALSLAGPARPEGLASWLTWGIDSDGWARSRCGLALRPRRGHPGVRLQIEVPPRPSPTWAGALSVAVDGRRVRDHRLTPGYLEVQIPVRGNARRLVLHCDSEIPVGSDPRQRAFRVIEIGWLDPSPRRLSFPPWSGSRLVARPGG